MKLFADPLEVGIFVGQQLAQHRRQQAVILLERFHNTAGRQIQLGEPPAIVLHLFNKL